MTRKLNLPTLSEESKKVVLNRKTVDGMIVQERKYKLITPLFGGGVEPGVNDMLTPISGKAIRGHLRFWWRATRGVGTIGEMRAREEEIWGGPSTRLRKIPSEVTLEVEIERDKVGNIIQLDKNKFGYVTFPLDDKLSKDLLSGTEFKLRMKYPKACEDDVKAALWAWETFGGIGARTRRGFGAIMCIGGTNEQELSLPDDAAGWKDRIEKQLTEFVVAGPWADGIPRLNSNIAFAFTDLKAGNNHQEALMDAWALLIFRLRSFRQLRQGFGRSFWPEPEKIRELTNQRLPKHAPLPKRKLDEFPRGAFGLPIIFHFKDAEKKDRNNPSTYNPNNPCKDPRDTILQLEGSERLASPVILRPLPCNGNKAVGMLLILNNGISMKDLKFVLKEQEGAPLNEPIKVRLDNQMKAAIIIRPDSGNKLLDGETDVLKAFLNYVKKG